MTRKYLYLVGALAILVVAIAASGIITRQTPLAKASEVVELKDGDTYDLVMDEIKKEIDGTAYTMLAYNGSIPGPLIKVSQGAEITIILKNNTDIETALHSHGVRLDNASDGVVGVTQETVKPGGRFSYKVKFPDAGMYWYHPHVRGDYAQEMGLYGVFIVEPVTKTKKEGRVVATSNDYWDPVNREVSLVLDDILMTMYQHGGSTEIQASDKSANHTLMGRFGNVMLTNGETDYKLSVDKGEVVRFYIVNVANARPFNFAIEGAKLKLVGGDNGAYQEDQWRDSVLLGPSERAIIEAIFDKSGTFVLQNRTPSKVYTLGNVVVSDAPTGISYANEFSELKTHWQPKKLIDWYLEYADKAPDKRLMLTVDMMGMGGMDHDMHGGMGTMMGAPKDGIEWEDTNQMMSAMSDASMVKWHIVDQDTGKKDMDIDWVFPRLTEVEGGVITEPVKIRIFNDPNSAHPMQHPIHFHGQRFLVVARDGVRQTNLVWKDTVLVKAGETVDILLVPSNPGEWMAHCHILEHIEAGMMFSFKVK